MWTHFFSSRRRENRFFLQVDVYDPEKSAYILYMLSRLTADKFNMERKTLLKIQYIFLAKDHCNE